jgi:hypothetical protein
MSKLSPTTKHNLLRRTPYLSRLRGVDVAFPYARLMYYAPNGMVAKNIRDRTRSVWGNHARQSEGAAACLFDHIE